ncbi:MAG: amino acid ABC transporter permease [Variibacter sp.]
MNKPTRLQSGSLLGRHLILQVALVVLIAAALLWMGENARYAMHKRGIAFGLDFLSEAAGFAIGQAAFTFSAGETYLRAFLVGVGNTIVLAVVAIVTATALGTAIGFARLSSNQLLTSAGRLYVELFRNSPPLLQILFLYTVFPILPAPRQAWSLFDAVFVSNRGIVAPVPEHPLALFGLLTCFALGAFAAVILYRMVDRRRRQGRPPFPLVGALYAALLLLPPLVYAFIRADDLAWSVPHLRGFNFSGGMTLSPEFLALYLGLSLYAAAFIAEVVRAGILSVDRGQIEAANAISLGSWDRLLKIVAPQALRVIVPPMASQYISIVKNSSLGVAIGYPELFSLTNTVLTYSGHTIEAVSIMAAIYLLISLAIGATSSVINQSVQVKER